MEEKYILEKEFINTIKGNDDFVCAYIVEEDKNLNIIWIVIKDARFENNIKYFHSERAFRQTNNCNIETIILDESEIDEIQEELKYIDKYELVNKEEK